MKITKILFLSLIISILTSCGLSNMASKYESVNINVTPPTLQAHAGNVEVNIDASFPEKYFAKTSTVEFTPVLISVEGEKKFKSIVITGTNGKSTTSKIIAHLLKKNNFKVVYLF